MSVRVQRAEFALSIPDSQKREKVFNSSGLWVNIIPKYVSNVNETILAHLLPLLPLSLRKSDEDKESILSQVSEDQKYD